jgi:hypothetical protein
MGAIHLYTSPEDAIMYVAHLMPISSLFYKRCYILIETGGLMAAIIIPNRGGLDFLNKMIKDPLAADEDYVLRLFKSDYTPDQFTVAADFDEADFTNYVSKTLTRAGFNDPALNGSLEAEIEYSAEQDWTCGSTGNTIYGYYMQGATSLVCQWAQRFSTPRSLTDTDVLKITPALTFRSQN